MREKQNQQQQKRQKITKRHEESGVRLNQAND